MSSGIPKKECHRRSDKRVEVFSKKDLTTGREFDIIPLSISWCGSMAEQLICNQQVDGSTPFTSSIFYGGIPERPKGADCKSVVTDFGGPNPPSPTRKKPSRKTWLFSTKFVPRGTSEIRWRV